MLAATAILIAALLAGVAAWLQLTTPPRPAVSLIVPLPPALIPKAPASAEAPAPAAPSVGTPPQTAVVPPGLAPKLTPQVMLGGGAGDENAGRRGRDQRGNLRDEPISD